MASNQIENERLTKRLEYMKQLNNEIKLNSEIDKLKAELRSSNIKLNDLQEEVTKLKHENQSLSMKENEFVTYRNKLLDAKIELISLRKENKKLEAEKKQLEENQKEKNIDQQQNQKSPKGTENSEPSQNLSDKKLLEAKLQIESLKQQISEKDMLNARLKAQQLSMATSTQAEITDLKNQLNEATKQINLLKSIKIELSVQVDALKQKLNDSITSNKKLVNKNSESKSASFSGTLPNNSFMNSDEYDEAPKLRSQIFSLSNELEKLKKANQPSLELDDARKEILSLRNQISELKNISQTGNFRNKNQNESDISSEKSNNAKLEEQNKLLQNQLAEKDQKISNLLSQIQDLESLQTKKQIDNTIIKESTINDLKRKISEHENELNGLRSQLSEKETELSSLKKKLDANNNSNNSNDEKNPKINSKLLEKDKIISDLKERLNSIQSNNDNSNKQNLQDEIAKLTSQLTEKDTQIKKIEKENKLLKNQINNGKSSPTKQKPQNESPDQGSNSPKSSIKDPQIIKLAKEILKLRKIKAKLEQQIDQLTQSDSLKDTQISTLRSQITVFQQFRVTEAKKDSELVRLQSQIDDYEANEEQREAQIQSKLAEKENEINNLKSEIQKLKNESNINNEENKTENQNNTNENQENQKENQNDKNENQENKKENQNEENQNNNKDENEKNQNGKNENANENKNKKENKKDSGNKGTKKVDDTIVKKLISEKEKIIDSYESQISKYQTQIADLENKILDYDNGKKQTIDTQRKLLEIDQLNDEIFLKDAEISSLKNTVGRQQKQIEDLEKVQYLYTNSSSDFYNSTNNDNELQLYQKNQEIAQLKLQISDQQDKINELTVKVKANSMNSYYDYSNYDSANKISNTEYLNLKQKCERLERELHQKNINEQIESQNMQKLKTELNSYQYKYNHLNDTPQTDGILYQTLKEEYSQLESKHQVALKLIGKLWARNQTLIQGNVGKSPNFLNDNDYDFTPDDFQFL